MSENEPTQHVVELVARSLDERLSPDEQKQVNAHLRVCLTCQIASDALREFDLLLKRTGLEMPEDGFALRVLARIEAYERRRTRLEVLLTLLLLFLGSLVLTVWVILEFARIAAGVGATLAGLVAFLPVIINTTIVLAVNMGDAALLAYALLALGIVYLWARVSGGMTASPRER